MNHKDTKTRRNANEKTEPEDTKKPAAEVSA